MFLVYYIGVNCEKRSFSEKKNSDFVLRELVRRERVRGRVRKKENERERETRAEKHLPHL
jgi:hypothetical protein